ncbi:MAG: C40 family peptidase [Actinomycetaceae bacterium]|nr:C40 family peptidase [Actinomycetaceae bacterium]
MKNLRVKAAAVLAIAALPLGVALPATADDEPQITDEQIAKAQEEENLAKKSVEDIEKELDQLTTETGKLEIEAEQAVVNNNKAQEKLWDALDAFEAASTRAEEAQYAVDEAREELGHIAAAMYRDGANASSAAKAAVNGGSLFSAGAKARAYDVLGKDVKRDLDTFNALEEVAKTLEAEADKKYQEQEKIAEEAEKSAENLQKKTEESKKRLEEISAKRDELVKVLAQKKGETEELVNKQREQKEEAARKAAAEEAERIRKAEEARQKELAAKAAAAEKKRQEEAAKREQARLAQEAAKKAQAEAQAKKLAASQSKKTSTAASTTTKKTTTASTTTKKTTTAAVKGTSTKKTVSATTITSAKKAATVSVSGSAIVAYARQFIGVPYVLGGTTTKGWDCSAFVGHVYRHFGITLPRTTAGIRSAGYTVVSRANARPGDLVWWPGHVGIYTGNGRHIAAVRPGVGTKEGALYGRPVFLRVTK